MAVAFVGLGTYLGTWAVVAADVEHALGVSHFGFGLLLAVALTGTACSGAVTGTLVERWGVARVLTLSCVVFATMIGLLGIAASYASFPILAVVIVGIFASSGLVDVTMNVAATAMLADRAGHLVRFHAFFNAGAALGAGLTAIVVHQTDRWQLAFVVPVAAMTMAAVAASRAHVPVGESGEQYGLLHALRTVRAEGLLLLAAVFALGAMVEGGIDTWGVLVLRDQLGVGIVVGATAQVVGQAVAATSRATLGPMAGSLGTARGIAVGAGLAAGGLLLLAVAPAPLAVAGLVVGAAGVSVCWPMLLAHAGQGRANPAGVISGVTAIGYLGFVVGPALIGSVAGLAGLRNALLLLAAAAVVVALAPRWIRSTPHTQPAPD